MNFKADGIRLNGPKVDGTYTVTFTVGEYERHKLKALLDIPPDVVLSVSVEVE